MGWLGVSLELLNTRAANRGARCRRAALLPQLVSERCTQALRQIARERFSPVCDHLVPREHERERPQRSRLRQDLGAGGPEAPGNVVAGEKRGGERGLTPKYSL